MESKDSLLSSFLANKPTSQKPCMTRGKVFLLRRVSLTEYYYTQPCCINVVPGNASDVWPENFHPAGSWNGWMTKSDCIRDRPPMM
jgi:thioesterase domain-containing protein